MSSWLDKIKNDIIIIMGNGKTFSPSWINAKKEIDYNVASFNFPEVTGTLVKRGTQLGRKFDLEIFFQGDNHLDISLDFETAAKDQRPWTIRHPYYNTLIVHPISLLFDNTQHNLTKITGSLLETITDNNPITTVSAVDQIQLLKENLDPTIVGTITATPSPKDANDLSTKNTRNFKLAVPIIKLPAEFEVYNNLFNQAETFVNTATATPLLAMRQTVALITAPAKFSVDIQTRLNLLQSQFTNTRNSVISVVNGNLVASITSPASKQIYQIMNASTISTMCYCYVYPFGTSPNSRMVLNQMGVILAAYNQYIADLDLLQTPNGATYQSFIPDPNSLISLNNLVNITIANLYQIALSAKSERKFILENDTNIINLTHRLYGLDPLDANIDELFNENEWGLNQILELKKGIEVVYYI